MNKICVYAICKNEEKFVDKWLDSMSEADYIVVLDTGSTDGTFEKLKNDKRVTKVKQKIFDTWRFDTARNESMKLIPKDANICVCTDFDEVFSEGWAQILRDSWKEDTNRAFYPYAWSHNSVGESTDVFMYDKIHDRHNYKWVYPVHEVLRKQSGDSQNEITLENVTLHHYPDTQKSRKFYFDLLEIAVKENPEDPHVLELYAREFMNNEDYDSAVEWFEKTLQADQIDTEVHHREKLYAMLQLAKIAAFRKDYATASKYAMLFLTNDKTYVEPYYMLAEIYNEYGFYTAALGIMEDSSKNAYQHYDWVEDSNSFTERPDDILSITYYGLHDIDNALYYCEQALTHAPDNIRLLKNQIAFLKGKLSALENNSQVIPADTVELIDG